jgi:hypothetical protein
MALVESVFPRIAKTARRCGKPTFETEDRMVSALVGHIRVTQDDVSGLDVDTIIDTASELL